MNRVLAMLAAVLVLGATLRSQISDSKPEAESRAQAAPQPAPVRFAAVDMFVDSGEQPLAAYQFELKVTAGEVALVGVEGGEHRAFQAPPYYDPRALAQQRIVVAALDAGSDLPHGKTRVARLMVRVSGTQTPAYEATLVVAASDEAKPSPATISVSEAPGSEGAER